MTGLTAFALPFVVALALSVALTPAVRWAGQVLGLVSRPKSDRWNRRTVPLLGGVAVWAATLGAVTLVGAWSRDLLPVALGGTFLFVAGLVDDVVGLRPNAKLSLEIIAGCVMLVLGTHLPWTDSPLVNAALTLVWIVGVTNAFNLLDNMDGLCTGVAAITAAAFCASVGPESPVFLYAAALAGASAGFLRYNFNPASVFLGDSGSLFIGMTFALLAASREPAVSGGVLSTIAVPVLLLLLPIFDTTFVTIARKLSNRAASQGGRDHTSHRLVALGFSERQATLVLYALAVCGGVAAYGQSRATPEAIGLGLALVALLAVLGVRLARVGVYDGTDFALLRDRVYTPLLVDVAYKRRMFEVLLDTCLIAIAYYTAYALRFPEDFRTIYYGLFVQSLPIVVACTLAGFFITGVYRGVWRYISLTDLFTYGRGVLLGTVATVITLVYLYRFTNYSRTVFMIHGMVLGLLLVGTRLAFRWLGEQGGRPEASATPAAIYGAGDGGALVLRELRNNPQHGVHPIAFLDDDPTKQHRRIMGLPVLGGIDDVGRLINTHRLGLVIVSTDKLPSDVMARLESVCWASGTRLQRMRFVVTEIAPEPAGRV
ncbi:MAG TPA: hypothetical protein VF198_01820 [Vicinamibacterales bacterium]